MPKLTIPSQHHAGISKLLAWDSATFDQFLAALESQPSSVSLLLPVSSSINVPNINREDGAAVFSAVAALHLVRAAADIELDQFVRDALEAIASFDTAKPLEEARDRLHRVLSIESLTVSAKAVTLLTDHERTLVSIRILSDVRHVFQSDAEKEPYGAVIYHMLKLSYHEGREHKEFFVALDGDDLASLRLALDRADAKTATLKRKLALADIAYLGGADRIRKGDN